MKNKRIVITGMAVNTPLGDELLNFHNNLLAGRSAICKWKMFNTDTIYSKLGGDLYEYDIKKKQQTLQQTLPLEYNSRLHSLLKRAPWATSLSLLVAIDAFIDAGLINTDFDNYRSAVVIAGHNQNRNYIFKAHNSFLDEPDFIDPLFALHSLDTDHASSISELLQLKGPTYTVGGACASGNMALRSGIDEILYHQSDTAIIMGPVFDYSPLEVQGMALMGAISIKSFNEQPEAASRPYDKRREGFVPSHGAAALIIEDLDHARKRGAKIYAEILGVESNAAANHLPGPSQQDQARLMRNILEKCQLLPQQIDYVNAHATSTPLGDLTEIRAIKEAFGNYAYQLKINALKSMLGHTCWSAAIVETVAAVLQMKNSVLYPSINIDELDNEVDLDICQSTTRPQSIKYCMKNSFGFGGLNSISIFKNFEQ